MSVKENIQDKVESFELALNSQDFWLKDAFGILQSAYQQNKFPHGLLINASKGFGQLKLAKAVGASLLCMENQEKYLTLNQLSLNTACGHCKSCLLLKANTHPDFNLVERLVEKGKLKQNISIDQIRNLSQKLVKTSQLQGWRITIINSVEDMNISSFNAILKTLEEPGQNTLVVLLSHGMGKVPATIKSRCQVLNLNADKNKTLDWLIDQGIDQSLRDIATNAVEICYGAPYASLEFIIEGYQTEYNQLFNDLDAILANQISANELITQHKEHIASLIMWLANYFHHVSKLLITNNEQRYINVPQKTVSNLYDQLINLNRAQSSGSNLQLSLQLEAILIHWFELGRKIVHYSKR